MANKKPTSTAHLLEASGLPAGIQERIGAVAARCKLAGDSLADVVEELIAHFQDGLASGHSANEMLNTFGDEQFAARLITKTKSRQTSQTDQISSWRRTGDSMLSTIRQNIRYGLRRLIKSPGFTVTAVLSLALGIGANTAIFTIVNAVLLRDLPLQASHELVDVYVKTAEFEYGLFSYPDFRDLRDGSDEAFVGVAATRLILVQSDRDGVIEMLVGEAVTGSYFPLLGVPAQLGRTLSPADDVSPGGHPVVMASHGYWQRALGGDPSAVGKEIRLAGRPYTIVGIAPESYPGSIRGLVPDLYLPVMMINELQQDEGDELEARGNHGTFVKGRLKPATTIAQADAVMAGVATRLREESIWNAGDEIALVPTDNVVIFPPIDRFVYASAWLLMGVVGLVLFIACSNLASFFLARAVDRRKEIALRLALGATRRGLIGQLITEATLLGLLGGICGIAFGVVLIKLLVGADLPLPMPITLDLTLDRTVLGFGIVISLAAGILFGLAPAIQATNADVAPTLRDETAGTGRSGKVTLRNALVVTQMAGSLVLLVGAALFLQSMRAAQSVDPGFGHDPAALVMLGLPTNRYSEQEGRVFTETLFERLRQLPNVRSVGLTSNLHLNKLSTSNVGFNVDGVDPPPDRDFQSADWAVVDDGFFESAGIQIVQGRRFRDSDLKDAPGVVIVNQAFVDRFWPGQDPIGRSIRRTDESWQVIGIAATAKIRDLTEGPRPFIYRPYSQDYLADFTVVAQTSGPAEGTPQQLLAVAREMDPEVWTWEPKTMERHLSTLLMPARMSALLLTVFAGLALLIASIGLYGIVSYAVAQRTREVGIRMSLGADDGAVVRLLMATGLKLVVVGGVVGLGLSLMITRALKGLLFGIESPSPLTFVVVPLVLGAVAIIAAYAPARRATSVNPVAALRAE